ncbi:hypothetical protein Leryth_019450 [Lithospermum erythrorhizon]|nr:hypothetical protein Leryth_019450 [Lithospermum erythrorhizon]
MKALIAFTSHLDDIFDSADRPLDGRRWWLKAEDPFQCLATCFNLTEALRSPSPETTLSHIPIHQVPDFFQRCLQWLATYAALGRDKLGAVAVNLVAGEKPADVYSGIAARVLDRRERCGKKILLMSQCVDCKTLIEPGGQEVGETNSNDITCYTAKTTLTALGEMFEAARDIMNWLGECAKVISMENQPVRWTTPLGLPVVQPYRKLGRHAIKTSLQVLTLQRETDKVMVKRQRTAFPPNFVHSLDGSHMMMTAIACKEAGLSFAGVHDSYWTHACDVDQMNRILREKFVELYEAPVLENLLESFQQSFPKLKFPPLPERGDFDLKEVAESPYFFN